MRPRYDDCMKVIQCGLEIIMGSKWRSDLEIVQKPSELSWMINLRWRWPSTRKPAQQQVPRNKLPCDSRASMRDQGGNQQTWKYKYLFCEVSVIRCLSPNCRTSLDSECASVQLPLTLLILGDSTERQYQDDWFSHNLSRFGSSQSNRSLIDKDS